MVQMAAFNDRRSGMERRRGDRRWLGYYVNKNIDIDKRAVERRVNKDRRMKDNDMDHINF